MPSTVLVTGGFGFIGAHVLQALVRAGDRVLVIDRQASGNCADDVLDDRERAEVEFVGSAIPAAEELADILRERRVDLVAHLASPLASRTESDPSLAVDEMIVPHRSILEAARTADVRRVVWASSVGVFGRASDYPRLPIPNDAPHYPLTIYGAAKSFLERLSAQTTEVHGLDTLGLRFPLVYGPARQRGGGLFTNRLIEGAARGEAIVAEGPDDRYDWMYVTDAARSVELALRAGQTPSRALTVGGDVATVREVADLLATWFPGAERRDAPGVQDLVADYDPEPARAEIGYAPEVSLHDGVLAMVNGARERAGLPLVA
jgi:nucleoside-diphosphate-sugar epimerase